MDYRSLGRSGFRVPALSQARLSHEGRRGDWSRPTRRSSSPTQLIMNRLEDQTVVCSSAAIVSAALRIAVA